MHQNYVVRSSYSTQINQDQYLQALAFNLIFSYNTIIETKHIKGKYYGQYHIKHRK